MNKKRIIKYAFIQAVIAVAYIAIVSGLMANGEKLFGKHEGALLMMAMLLLLVLSVAVMGVTIFGKPIIWYLNDLKKEAIILILYTLGFLIITAIIFFAFLALWA
ncbi:hypothetical protein JW698_02585 [Candidatus Wolfebacteria bacterium]|nr:hypothetical protein [Candidatus Wolfebacteria bacterium]